MEDATSQTLRLPPLPAPTSDTTPSHCFASVSGFVTVLKTPAGHGIHTGASPASAAVLANICLTRCSLASVNTLSSFKPQINMILPLSFQILPSSHMPRFQIYRHIPDRTYVHRDSEASRSCFHRPQTPWPPTSCVTDCPMDTQRSGRCRTVWRSCEYRHADTQGSQPQRVTRTEALKVRCSDGQTHRH